MGAFSWDQKKHLAICKECKKQFDPYGPYELNWPHARRKHVLYCSVRCERRYNARRYKNRHTQPQPACKELWKILQRCASCRAIVDPEQCQACYKTHESYPCPYSRATTTRARRRVVPADCKNCPRFRTTLGDTDHAM